MAILCLEAKRKGMVINMKTTLIYDSCCDLTPGLLKDLDIRRASFHIDIDDKHFLDASRLNPLELIPLMHASKNAAKTACPSPEEYLKEMLDAELCFVVCISSRLSASYNAAVTARELALEQSPGKKIHVFDTKSAAAGETCVALRIQACVESGLSFEETVEDVSAYIGSLHTNFILKDLDNLMKNGRLGKVKGTLGMLLGIYPIFSDDGNGEIIVLEKVRGLRHAVSRLVEIIRENLNTSLKKATTLVISHCNCEERALDLEKQLRAIHADIRRIIVVPAGGLSTVYANDGGIVLAY
jgi:DegV family protein with EDD domain